VKLITNSSGEAVAVKIVDIKKHPRALADLKKEVAIHRMTKHPNIIHFYGHRREISCEYIFIEYASGGELFDRIGTISFSYYISKRINQIQLSDPDLGMPVGNAQKYFTELIAGVVSY
jgi:serine/threonine-protein kinase CHEK1